MEGGVKLLNNFAQAGTFYQEFNERYAAVPQTKKMSAQEIAKRMLQMSKKTTKNEASQLTTSLSNLKSSLNVLDQNLR